MPEIMNVTNPTPGHDAAGSRAIPNTITGPGVQNIPNPSRVTSPDANTGERQSASEGQTGPLRYDSNFQTFLHRLGASGDAVGELARFLTGESRLEVVSGLRAGTAEELSAVLEMLEMSEGEFLQFLQDQAAASTRFGGPLFDLLRAAYTGSGSAGLRGDLLQFLKQYGDWAATGHLETTMLLRLDQIARAMPRSWGGRVAELTAQLQNGAAAGDRAGNLKLLQGQILPYLSDYVSRSHDMGRARGLLTMLVLDVARYENGAQDALLASLRRLSGYGALRSLGGLDDAALLSLLRRAAGHGTGRNPFGERLAAAANTALRGSMGAEAQEVFRNLMHAQLVNESVYMPLSHYLIPLKWKERTLFSEMWVDPDAERGPEEDGGVRTVRLLIKADVQSLGLFDLVLTCRGKTVSLDVRCPERAAAFTDLFQSALSGILRDNGLEVGSIQVDQMDRPLTVSEVFPAIFDGRDSINVKV